MFLLAEGIQAVEAIPVGRAIDEPAECALTPSLLTSKAAQHTHRRMIFTIDTTRCCFSEWRRKFVTGS
jgi:hypothetical protein